jgi:hypothetical protein
MEALSFTCPHTHTSVSLEWVCVTVCVVSWLDPADNLRLHWSRDGIPFASQTLLPSRHPWKVSARRMHEFLDPSRQEEELLTRAMNVCNFDSLDIVFRQLVFYSHRIRISHYDVRSHDRRY